MRTSPSGHALSILEHYICFLFFSLCWWATGEPSWLIQNSTKSLGTWWVQELHYIIISVCACTHAQMCFSESRKNRVRKMRHFCAFVLRQRVHAWCHSTKHCTTVKDIGVILNLFSSAILKQLYSPILKEQYRVSTSSHPSREAGFVFLVTLLLFTSFAPQSVRGRD